MTFLFLFILGLAIGSFLNVLADRLSFEKSINGRSHCDYCDHVLSPLDLVPLFSFLFLQAKCRYCHHTLSWYYPIAELICGIAFLFVWIYAPADLFSKVNYLLVISSLIGIFLADIKYQIIPDELLIALGIFSAPFILPNPIDHLLGAAFLSAILYLIYFITRKKGIGFGDVKFAIVMGLLLGSKSGFFALYIAFIIGGIVATLLLLLHKKKKKSKIAFGPFLILGVCIMLFFSREVLQFFYHLTGL